MSYAKKAITNLRIPGSSESDLAIESFHGGKLVTSFSQAEIVKKSKDIYNRHIEGTDKTLPVFLTVSLQYPLGLATFVGSLSGSRKVFIPSTYNVAKITKSFNFQKSEILV